MMIRELALLAVAVGLTGCSLPQPAATGYDPAAAKRPPACTHAGRPIPTPAAFPPHFPLPAGTALTFSTLLERDVTVTGGFIASGDFDATVKFFQDYLPLSGFAVQTPSISTRTEVDQLFWGNGHTGVWSVKRMQGRGCTGELELSVQTVPVVWPPGSHNGRAVDPY